MQQTTKYQFKLIEGSDDFSPQPLNDNVEKVEEVLGDMEDAMADALEEMETAVGAAYSPDNKPYVMGTYTGNGYRKTIEIGFKPSAVLISGNLYDSASEDAGKHICFVLENTTYWNGSFTSTGIELLNTDSYPKTNEDGRKYLYIAFR